MRIQYLSYLIQSPQENDGEFSILSDGGFVTS